MEPEGGRKEREEEILKGTKRNIALGEPTKEGVER